MSLLLVFFIFFKYSSSGFPCGPRPTTRSWRSPSGIQPRKILSLTWASVRPWPPQGGSCWRVSAPFHVNLSYIGLAVFPVVILGGLDSIVGALSGGLVVGVIEAVAGVYIAPLLGGAFQQVAAFASVDHPASSNLYGLFGSKEIERLLIMTGFSACKRWALPAICLVRVSLLPLQSLLLIPNNPLLRQHTAIGVIGAFGAEHPHRLHGFDFHGAGRFMGWGPTRWPSSGHPDGASLSDQPAGGGIVTTIMGILAGTPSLRLKGFYLAMATLSAQFLLESTSSETGKG